MDWRQKPADKMADEELITIAKAGIPDCWSAPLATQPVAEQSPNKPSRTVNPTDKAALNQVVIGLLSVWASEL
jgi:hypothetical protein